MTQGSTPASTVSPLNSPKQKTALSDWCVDILAQCQITHYFGYPGAAIAPLYDALGRTRHQRDPLEPELHVITTKHESASAHAAEGYFRATQKIAVCIATAGPGVANTVAGVASAAIERIPMLVITGCPPVKDFARGTFQDISGASDLDAVSMMAKVCKFSAMATHPLQLPHLLFKALSIAHGESPGPVHICVPLDVFQTSISSLSEQLPTPSAFAQSLPKFSRGLDLKIMQHLLSKLLPANVKEHSERVTVRKACLVLGGGCITVAQDLLRLAKTLEWDVVGTPCSKGLIAHDHPSFCGIMGLGGHPLAYETLSKPDQIVIIVGTRFDESETGGWSAAQLSFENTIQIDQNPENLFCYMPIKTRYLCDLELFAQTLEQHLLPHAPLEVGRAKTQTGDRPKYIIERHWALTTAESTALDETIKPQTFMGTLNTLAAPAAHICSDSGSAFMWTTHLWPSMPSTTSGANPNRFHVAMGFGMMGWSIGASLGVAQALKAAGDPTPCLCVVGDGAYLMSSHEIGTALQHNLKIAYFIINNSSLGIVEHCQKILGAEQIAYELPMVRYTAHGDAFDLPSFEIITTEDLEKGWDVFSNQEGPALFDVKVDHSELSPLGFRLQSLGFSEKNEL